MHGFAFDSVPFQDDQSQGSLTVDEIVDEIIEGIW
ncbi:hypothetical protein QF032_007660 [Streptomyces achromogenes]|uniref:Uncharacterized protein n=1 Tax=Streptomyces achromogenes TaxID=67255 RepID=A0ABU0QD89_STRAH|nr:hypothetical protein [Streptomyces achromogenes]MDQ0835816.1 hypothetical protein [Streptomyces achromogenes]